MLFTISTVHPNVIRADGTDGVYPLSVWYEWDGKSWFRSFSRKTDSTFRYIDNKIHSVNTALSNLPGPLPKNFIVWLFWSENRRDWDLFIVRIEKYKWYLKTRIRAEDICLSDIMLQIETYEAVRDIHSA